MEEALRENERLRTELDSLRNELDDREKLLLQAGEMSKKVLEMNQELHNKMEDMTREFTEQLTQKVEVCLRACGAVDGCLTHKMYITY